jgi:hypothetical protein
MPVFLPRYPEPRKVSSNPRWCPYAKRTPHEGQAPRLSNFVQSHKSSPRASGALLLAPLGHSPPSTLSSFRPKQCGPRSLWYTVAAVTQTGLSRSHKTLAPLGTILQWLMQEPRVVLGFSYLTQLTSITLEQVQ